MRFILSLCTAFVLLGGPPRKVEAAFTDYEKLSCSVVCEKTAQIPTSIPEGAIEPVQPEKPLPNTLPSLAPLTPPLITPYYESPTNTQPPPVGNKVQVERIEVFGNTIFLKDIQRIVKQYEGRKLSFEQLLSIRSAITNLYVSHGYITSGAFLSVQDITDGVVRVQVLEGELEEITIQGLKRLRENYVLSRLATVKQSPVNLQQLVSKLQLLQLDPLFERVEAELVQGSSLQHSVLLIKLQEAPALNSSFKVDNYESPSIGSLGATAAISHNNILGFGDRLEIDAKFTRGINSYDFDYQFPINAQGGTVRLHYSNGSNRVIEPPFAPLNIKGQVQTYAVSFRQPIIRTPQTEFTLGLSADFSNSETFLLDDEPYSFSTGPENGVSRIRAIRFTQDWVNRQPNQVIAVRSQLNWGLGILGATVNDTGVDGRFLSWLGQVQWVRSLNAQRDAIVAMRAAAQLTGDSLLPLEQFSIGGINTIRGYRTNQRLADNGIVGSIEVQLPVLRSNSFGLLQIVPFLDAGVAWDNRDATTEMNTLVGTGLGLRWRRGSFTAQLDWGIPLVEVEGQGSSLQESGVYFSVEYNPF